MKKLILIFACAYLLIAYDLSEIVQPVKDVLTLAEDNYPKFLQSVSDTFLLVTDYLSKIQQNPDAYIIQSLLIVIVLLFFYFIL